MIWKLEHITIKTQRGPVCVEAHIYNGLAIHRPADSFESRDYAISHVKSGKKVFGGIKGKKIAQEAVLKLLETSIDWESDDPGEIPPPDELIKIRSEYSRFY